MKQINASKNVKQIKETTEGEAQGLIDAWQDPDFPPKMMKFMMSL